MGLLGRVGGLSICSVGVCVFSKSHGAFEIINEPEALTGDLVWNFSFVTSLVGRNRDLDISRLVTTCRYMHGPSKRRFIQIRGSL